MIRTFVSAAWTGTSNAQVIVVFMHRSSQRILYRNYSGFEVSASQGAEDVLESRMRNHADILSQKLHHPAS